MAILPGTACPRHMVEGQSPRQESAGKKFPLGEWMRSYRYNILLYSMFSCLLFCKVLAPLHYSQTLNKGCHAQRTFVGGTFISSEEKGGQIQFGKRREITGEEKVGKYQEVRRSRKPGQDLTRIAIDFQGIPQNFEVCAIHLPVSALQIQATLSEY